MASDLKKKKKNQDRLAGDQEIWGGVSMDICISMTESREHGDICT